MVGDKQEDLCEEAVTGETSHINETEVGQSTVSQTIFGIAVS